MPVQRVFLGPEKDWLSAEEAALWLGISVTTFRKRVKAKEIPDAVHFGDKVYRWNWMDVVAYGHLQMRLSRPAPGEGES